MVSGLDRVHNPYLGKSDYACFYHYVELLEPAVLGLDTRKNRDVGFVSDARSEQSGA